MRNYENGSRHADKFVVRLPDGMRDQVDAAAVVGDTSMNSIVIKAIRQYIEGQERQALLLDALGQAAKAREEFDIDEHARMAADARRYRLLRDTDEFCRPPLIGILPSGDALDEFMDEALRLLEMLNVSTEEAFQL